MQHCWTKEDWILTECFCPQEQLLIHYWCNPCWKWVNADGMTQALWARKFYEIAAHFVCAKNSQVQRYIYMAQNYFLVFVSSVQNQIFKGIYISFWMSLNIIHLFPGSGQFPCWLWSSWSSGHTGHNVEGLWWRLFFQLISYRLQGTLCCGVKGSVGTLRPISVWLNLEMDFFCFAGNVVLQQTTLLTISTFASWSTKIDPLGSGHALLPFEWIIMWYLLSPLIPPSFWKDLYYNVIGRQEITLNSPHSTS